MLITNLIMIVLLLLSIVLLVTFIVGIAKKNKRLWVTSLILLILISLTEITMLTATFAPHSQISTENHLSD